MRERKEGETLTGRPVGPLKEIRQEGGAAGVSKNKYTVQAGPALATCGVPG